MIFISQKTINIYIYISYILKQWLRDFTLGSCLLGSVKLTTNADPDKCKYNNYCIVFNSRSEFLFADRSAGKNVIIFGTDMSSSVHIHNKNEDVLILGEVPTQGLDDTTLAAEAKYPFNFTQPKKNLY